MEEKKRWDHQIKCVEKARTRDNLAIFASCGVGKTLITVDIIRELCNRERTFFPTLILCPKIVVKKWKEEFSNNSKVPPEQIILLVGSGKQRLSLLQKARAKFHGKMIVVCNYESVQMKELLAEIMSWAPKVLVCDEVHRCKNPTALRTKKVIQIAKNSAKYKYILTGSPILNSPLDLFAQYLILDGGETFSKNFFVFRASYFYDRNSGMPKQSYFPDWVLRKDSKEKIAAKIAASSFQARKEECLTLPPLLRVRINVDMAPIQAKSYKQMEDQFITFVNGSACIAELAITKSLRLQQLVTGFVNNDDGAPELFDENPRLEALEELLESLVPTEKVLVWCNFKEQYRMIGEMLTKNKIKHVFLTGEQTTKQQNESEKSFNEDPEVRVLVGHPKSAGIGVDFIEASSMVYYSRSFSLEDNIQSEARNYRGGSEKHPKITRYDLVAKDTIDEVILDALDRKENVGKTILNFARQKAYL